MFANFKKIPTSGLNDYAGQLLQRQGTLDDVSFPCGAALSSGVSIRSMLSSTRNTNQMPATLECGDMLWGGESAVCMNCYAEYKHQKYGDVESIPLRGSREAQEAEEEVEAAAENGLSRFIKEHPYLTAGFSALFAIGVVGAAVGTYKTLRSSSYSASTQIKPATVTKPTTTLKPVTSQPATTLLETTQATTAEATTPLEKTQPATVTLEATQPLTTEAVTNWTTTTAMPATNQSTTLTPVMNLSTTAEPLNATTEITVLTSPKYEGVKQISLLVENYRALNLTANFKVCADSSCSRIIEQIGLPKEGQPAQKNVTIDLPENYSSAEVDYDYEGKHTISLMDALGSGYFDRGKVNFPKSSDINNHDKNLDGRLEIRHTLLRSENFDSLAQVFEDEQGMPKYSGVTAVPVKIVLDNRWRGDAYFALIGKRALSKVEYSQVQVHNYQEKNLPVGISSLQVGLNSYPKKTFDAQQLNAAIVKDGTNTICITAKRDGAPTYLSDIKHGRCGR